MARHFCALNPLRHTFPAVQRRNWTDCHEQMICLWLHLSRRLRAWHCLQGSNPCCCSVLSEQGLLRAACGAEYASSQPQGCFEGSALNWAGDGCLSYMLVIRVRPRFKPANIARQQMLPLLCVQLPLG